MKEMSVLPEHSVGLFRRGSLSSRRAAIWAIRLGFIGSILVAWEVSSRAELVNPVFIGQPTKIAMALVSQLTSPLVSVDLPTTLYETVVGFLLGSALGIATGVIFVWSDVVYRALQPVLTAANSLPRVALGPLFIIWFGLGVTSKIALSVSLVYFIVLLSTVTALTQTDRDVTLLARTLGASELNRLRLFVLPGAVPVLAVGFELGLIYSFLGAVVGEFIGGEHGLGVRLSYFANVFRTNDFFATLIILAIVTTVLTMVIAAAVRASLKWHYIEMAGATK